MLCAISGEVPQVPVISRRSGNLYEKRLIESYIGENGTEPTTGQPLTIEDLLEVQTSQSVRPRPPTLTSIPALLGVFQEEWDALALESYTLQQNLAQTRQELSTALYQHDAAVRVIARLTRERDEARAALAKINVGGRTSSANGTSRDEMQVDNAPLPGSVIAKVETTQESLMKTRRKRPIPQGWATSEEISNLKLHHVAASIYPGSRFLATNRSGESILLGGADGVAGVFSVPQLAVSATFKGDGASITDGAWADDRAVFSTSQGSVKVFQGPNQTASFRAHSESVTGLAVHPSGDLLASISSDKSYVLYDLESSKVLTQVFTDSTLSSVQFHPDGHLLAVGGADGQIKFYDVKTGSIGGTFDTGSPLSSLFFSENGTWIAAANTGSSVVSIWDLRKVGASTEPIKTIDAGGIVDTLNWDYTAQYLIAGGPAGISVEQYTKATKEWSEPLRLAVPASAVGWGTLARSIYVVDSEGSLTILA